MKQVPLVIAFLMMTTLSRNSAAQSNNDLALNYRAGTVPHKAMSPHKKFQGGAANVNANILEQFSGSNRILSETKIMNVNINAVRDFIRSYRNIPDAIWFATQGGYTAYFVSKEIHTKIVYDKKGRWMYNLFEYTEGNLAFEIRDMVKRKYYDDEILVIHQFEFHNSKTVYLIRMMDRQSKIVTLKVCNEEMEYITAQD